MALDYGVLFARMDRLRLSDDDWEDIFQMFTVIEDAAVKAINARNKQ